MSLRLFFFLVFLNINLFAQSDTSLSVLIIDAHPDDEMTYAATAYKITHELNGIVDLAVITNGEGGYKYSLLAEPYYHLKLTDESIGRKYLPTIRKNELMGAGKIIGIGKYFFLDQLDNHYTLDMDTVLKDVWDVPYVKSRLKKIMEDGKYDYVFCLIPTPETHGHHKGATFLALECVNELKTNKPIILAGSNSNKNDTTTLTFSGLEKYPITKISSGKSSYSVDRNISFGFKNKLNYKLIVSWEIAEHKSQGSITPMIVSDYENFWYFDINSSGGRERCEKLFKRLNDWRY